MALSQLSNESNVYPWSILPQSRIQVHDMGWKEREVLALDSTLHMVRRAGALLG